MRSFGWPYSRKPHHRRVHVHRYRVFGFARLHHPADVARIVPGHEGFIRRDALPEHLFPGPGGLEAGRLPHLAKLGYQPVLVLLKVVHQLQRRRRGECPVGRGRAVAGVPFHIHFVLHLDHEDRVLLPVHFLDVPHQRGKGACVGVPVRIAERGKQFDGLPIPYLDARKALEVLLHPVGRVAGGSVLPTSEPQKHQTQVVAPCIPDRAVHCAEVELGFPRFDLVPGNARQDGVELGLGELGPNRLHVLQTGGAAVVQFPGQHQKGLAVYDQLGGRPLLLQVRDIRG